MTEPADAVQDWTRATVPVDIAGAPYDILIEPGLLDRAGVAIASRLGTCRCVVVTDETVARLYLARLSDALAAAALPLAPPIVVPPGEETKSLEQWRDLVSGLLDRRVRRQTLVLALGGGVVGDLAGFAAAATLRGLPFVQVPTTLLAQVDSSVGGKTGINAPQGKNLIGAFHQPRLVLADTATLATLPRRERAAGYAEIVKYGLIDRPALFARLEALGTAIVGGDAAATVWAVAESCRAKAAIVARDPHEASDRALLNLGHTFGHAIEAVAGYGRVLHGQAVALGLVLAFALSARLGLCSPDDALRVRTHLARQPDLPTGLAEIGLAGRTDDLLAAMRGDKKATEAGLTFILARGIGAAFIASGVPEPDLRAVLDAG